MTPLARRTDIRASAKTTGVCCATGKLLTWVRAKNDGKDRGGYEASERTPSGRRIDDLGRHSSHSLTPQGYFRERTRAYLVFCAPKSREIYSGESTQAACARDDRRSTSPVAQSPGTVSARDHLSMSMAVPIRTGSVVLVGGPPMPGTYPARGLSDCTGVGDKPDRKKNSPVREMSPGRK
jgi:hypothetical protein